MLSSYFLCFILSMIALHYFANADLTPEVIREDGPETHLKKQGTPTMAGLCFGLVALICMGLFYPCGWPLALCATGFLSIGAVDDWVKIRRWRHGLSMRSKFILIYLFSCLFMEVIWQSGPVAIQHIPFSSVVFAPDHLTFILCGAFILTATVNASNFSDGLDGLCVLQFIALFAGLLALNAFGSTQISSQLLAAGYIFSASLAFLWFNAAPARLFMGDSGSLLLGAVIAYLYICSGYVLYLPLTAIVWVVEVLSVMIQIIYFKRSGKRFFKMAPLHHHFELEGWSNAQVVLRFWVVTLLMQVVVIWGMIN